MVDEKTFLSILLAELWNWVAPYIRTTPTKNKKHCLPILLPLSGHMTACPPIDYLLVMFLVLFESLWHSISVVTHQKWVKSPSIKSNLLNFFFCSFVFRTWFRPQEMAVTNRAITNRAFLVQFYCCCFCILCPNKDFLLLWSSRFPVPFVFPQMQDETEKPYK